MAGGEQKEFCLFQNKKDSKDGSVMDDKGSTGNLLEVGQ